MAKNLVNGTNIIIEENGDNINMNLSSTYNTALATQINTALQNYFECKILWNNPSPTSAFAAQTITLSSGDYDFYEVFFIYNTTSASQYANGFKSIKEKGVIGFEIGYAAGTLIRRKIDYTDATHLLVYDGMNGNSADNGIMIPIYVIGYKTGTF